MKNNKATEKNKVIKLVIIGLIILPVLGSCDMFVNWFGTTVSGRVDSFNRDLTNGNYDQLYTHFSSDIDHYDSMKGSSSETYWEGTDFYPNTGTPPTEYVSIKNYSGDDPVTGVLSDSSIDFDKSFKFEMVREGMVYYIKKAYVEGTLEVRELK